MPNPSSHDVDVDGLMRFIDASPSPHHAVDSAAAMLSERGFAAVPTTGIAPDVTRGFTSRNGALIAWSIPPGGWRPGDGFRIVGAHTDSPGWRVRPQPDAGGFGYRQLALEPYGGLLVNSWLDRDLGLAGIVFVDDGDGTATPRLVDTAGPVMRIPQLAIHLDRDVNERGLQLNKQTHMVPVAGLGEAREGLFEEWLADRCHLDAGRVLSWDLAAYDVSPSAVVGFDGELLSAPRLDDLACCYGALAALVRPAPTDAPAGGCASVVVLFDHEEVGSESATGAAGPALEHTLERLTSAPSIGHDGGGRAGFLDALAASKCLSADMAHAVHPNYAERHEPNHRVRLGGGPVVKLNVNQRYATDAETQAGFEMACARAGIPTQRYSHRADMACGSTIGPITATRLGIPTVDVGMPMLSMHSARELMGTSDVSTMVDAFVAWLTA